LSPGFFFEQFLLPDHFLNEPFTPGALGDWLMKYTSLISAIAGLTVIFATCATRLEASAIEDKGSYVCDVLAYCERWEKFPYSDVVVPLWTADVNSVAYDLRPPINQVCVSGFLAGCTKSSPFYEFLQQTQDRNLKRLKNLNDLITGPKSPFMWGKKWQQTQKYPGNKILIEWKNKLKKCKKINWSKGCFTNHN